MWTFREELKENHLIEHLFAKFDECLRELDVELKSCQIVDATFVTVPKQRNTHEEKSSYWTEKHRKSSKSSRDLD